MGVDYDANFGIGFEIEIPDYGDEFSDYDEWFNHLLKETTYSYIEWGNAYDGEYYYAVVVDKESIPHYSARESNFIKFGDELKKLHQFLLDAKIKIIEEQVGWVVGGSYIS